MAVWKFRDVWIHLVLEPNPTGLVLWAHRTRRLNTLNPLWLLSTDEETPYYHRDRAGLTLKEVQQTLDYFASFARAKP